MSKNIDLSSLKTLGDWVDALVAHLAGVTSLLCGLVSFCHTNGKKRSDINDIFKAKIVALKDSYYLNDKGEALSYNTVATKCKADKKAIPQEYRDWQSIQTQLGRLQWDDEGNPVVVTNKKGQITPVYKEKQASGGKQPAEKAKTVKLDVNELQEWFDTVRGKKKEQDLKFFYDFCARFDIVINR